MSQRQGIRHRFAQVVLLVILAGFFALAGRLVYINLGKDKGLLTKWATHQQQAFRPIPAVRGTIYDRKGRILAGTKIVPGLYADPAIVQDQVHMADVVSAVLQINADVVLNRLRRDPNLRFIWLARDITPDAVSTLSQLDLQKKLRGLGIQNVPKRVYTAGMLGGHVLGAANVDGVGQEGIELRYNSILGGQDGQETYVRDAARRKIWLIKSDCKPPVNGQHIILTIDAVVQQFTQRILTKTCNDYKAESGVAVVMDPKTGDVLAMANWPEVDPNEFGNTPPDKRRNRAITDPYEPGSIFKPFIAAHALAMGVTRVDESIFCHNGNLDLGKRTIHDVHGYGNLTMAQIVIKSSNIGMSILGMRLGNDRLYYAVTSFGFGSKTGVDLPGEDPGIVLPLRRWTSFSTPSVSFGQEIATTSLQLVSAFAAMANDGVLLQPRFFRASIDEQGQMKEKTDPIIRRQVIPKEIARVMVREIMRGVCTIGTGKRGDLPGYQVFGKTGTAQIARGSHGKGHFEDAYVASFLGGAPASNPQVVAVVSVRRPDKRIGHFGGTVSAPAVKEILQSYFVEYMHIPPFENPDTGPATPVDERE